MITGDTAIDGRADVYSLACTLFRLLTGSVPFPGHNTAAAMAHAHLEQAAPKPSALLPWAPPALDAVMAKALAKRPADRYATAGELAVAATQALSPSPVPSPSTTPPPPRVSVTPVESSRRALPKTKRWLILGGAAAGGLVAVVLAWLASTGHDDTAAPISHPQTTTSTPAPPPRKKVLPSGCPPGACTRQDSTDPSTEVVMTCGPNQDPGGPISGTYSLARDAQSLQKTLAHVIGAATTVICPGNIASAGPWKHSATPNVVVGTVFSGVAAGEPILVWTNESELLLARTETATTDMNALYIRWSSHS